jgi:chromosome partitioning protein
MGRIVAVTNLKGGIGKTTTVVNVGAGLALKGARVLLVDVDAQGNLSPALGVTPKHTIYEVLVDRCDPTRCIIPARPNLDLLPADDSLLSAQALISQRPDWSRVLEQALTPLKRSYDFILIDAPGSLTVLSANALSASTDLLVPTTVESLSLKGLNLLFKQVARLKPGSSSVRLIVPTLFDARLRQSNELLEQLRTTYGALIANPIRVNVRLSEATSAGQTIYEYDRRSRGALDYAHLVDRLSDMLGFQAPPRKSVPKVSNGHTVPAEVAVAQPVTNGADTPAPVQQEQPVQQPAAAVARNGRDPVVAGAGNVLQEQCPNCGHPLRRATLAGYRVSFCDHCKYKQQELVQQAR